MAAEAAEVAIAGKLAVGAALGRFPLRYPHHQIINRLHDIVLNFHFRFTFGWG